MRIEELTSELLCSVEVRDFEKEDLRDNLSKNLGVYMSSDFKKAVINNQNKVVLAYGGKIESDLVAWVWMIGSEFINENPIASLETLISLESMATKEAKERGIKFFYTLNHPNFNFALKYLRRMGYSEKGLHLCSDNIERLIMVKEI